VVGLVERGADLGDAARHARGGLVVDDGDGADGVVGVACEDLLDVVGVDAVAPVSGDPVDVEPELLRHLAPQGREVAGLEGQDAVAGRERVDERGLPGARAR
jgi:hypothetical protein